jgi:hypothetical protein
MISYRESQLLDMIDKPTKILSDGTKIWKNKERQRHRGNDKPAIEWNDGRKEWYINDKFIKQNYDKKGIIYNDKFFDIYGNEIKTTTAQLRDMINKNNLKSGNSYKGNNGYIVIGMFNTTNNKWNCHFLNEVGRQDSFNYIDTESLLKIIKDKIKTKEKESELKIGDKIFGHTVERVDYFGRQEIWKYKLSDYENIFYTLEELNQKFNYKKAQLIDMIKIKINPGNCFENSSKIMIIGYKDNNYILHIMNKENKRLLFYGSMDLNDLYSMIKTGNYYKSKKYESKFKINDIVKWIFGTDKNHKIIGLKYFFDNWTYYLEKYPGEDFKESELRGINA